MKGSLKDINRKMGKSSFVFGKTDLIWNKAGNNRVSKPDQEDVNKSVCVFAVSQKILVNFAVKFGNNFLDSGFC